MRPPGTGFSRWLILAAYVFVVSLAQATVVTNGPATSVVVTIQARLLKAFVEASADSLTN